MRRHRILVLVVVCLGLGLAGCGVGQGSGQTAQHTPTGAGSGGAQANGTPGEGSPTPGNHLSITSGQVTVELGAQRYSPDQSITVAIANGQASSIFATDHHTNCTLVTLEQEVAGGWQPQGRCAEGIMTRVVEMKPNTELPQVLMPGSGTMRGSPLPAGSYRVVLAYAIGAENGPHMTAASATFEVG